MSDIEFCPLPPICQPLLDKFYRAHRSPMRASGTAQMWVARQQEIIGALNLTPVADGYWLTGLFVAPQWRSQAIAGRLIAQALESLTGPVWLFCQPELVAFYERSGFTPASELPPVLADKLTRYQRTKELGAMQWER
ncbi:GNAT family N-acetyltransferase [Pseudomonas viridiflava]|uniref:GNAT family N-acetyltransferase n=1 Tax=Pseudomonas viridiflava TaxID=33069 RepID=UPI000F0630FD|nr:GNAT family N-acetyltransferase [Pseudomonas viridiflava]